MFLGNHVARGDMLLIVVCCYSSMFLGNRVARVACCLKCCYFRYVASYGMLYSIQHTKTSNISDKIEQLI